MELYDNLLIALEQIQLIFSKQELSSSWKEEFEAFVRDAKENSRVLVMGEFNAGKSTLG